MIDDFEDIIHLPHHVSTRHPQMSMMNRAAQFAPFAALNGHDEAIRESARLTDQATEMSETRTAIMNRKMCFLRTLLPHQQPEVCITYFQPDSLKQGGCYKIVNGCIKKIDDYNLQLILTNGEIIPIQSIFEMEGTVFTEME